MHNQLVRRNSKRGSSRNIRAHYDVGNAFYSLWLDKTMTYSSALDTSATTPLEQAQTNKYQRILGRIEQQNASVLEIGSGWGGFAEQAVGSSHQITGLTVSPAQHEFSRKRLGSAADIRLQDYRDVRGLVAADYQEFLEKEWIKALRAKYPVKVNDDILKTVKKN